MIEAKTDGGLWTVTINRPEKANSLTKPMLERLAEIAEKARSEARVLVLTGAGRVFSAGADLDEVKSGLATDDVWERLSNAIAELPCLTIAALNGTLAGGAFGMALACDIRIAARDARFFYPVMKLGFLPQPSDPARLTALVGPARAKLVLMAGARLTAKQALKIGLVDQLCRRDELDAAARGLASDALGADKARIARIKAMIPD